MKRLLAIFLLCLCVAPSGRAHATADNAAEKGAAAPFAGGIAVPLVYLSSDSEGFDAEKIGAGLYPFYRNGDNYIGLNVTANRFS